MSDRIPSPHSAALEATFDVIVIGGGHAGTEAAVAAARSGAQVALITGALEQIGQLSCNPAIGGIAKGTVVREVDALGGIIARATDMASVQFRMLNRGKGPAVWAPRAQCDRGLYRRAVRTLLEAQPNLITMQGMVARLLFDALPIARVQADTATDNPAERKALERAGFTCEALLRGAEVRDGRVRDRLLFSMTRADLTGG